MTYAGVYIVIAVGIMVCAAISWGNKPDDGAEAAEEYDRNWREWP